MTTWLVKPPGLAGANRIVRFVVPNAGKVKGVPDRIVNAPPGTVATPLVTVVPPKLVNVKLNWALAPTTRVPKFRLEGDTASCPGASAVPVTALVLLPPLLVMTTWLLKLPELVGAKRIVRFVVPKAGNVNGVPDKMLNGPADTVATPLLNATPPELVRVKLSCALAPTTSDPKLRLAGATANCAGATPDPVTAFVLLPPLLMKVTALLK